MKFNIFSKIKEKWNWFIFLVESKCYRSTELNLLILMFLNKLVDYHFDIYHVKFKLNRERKQFRGYLIFVKYTAIWNVSVKLT